MTPAFNVLFLCTHNSARSIIAEALLNTIGTGRFHASSAGSDPIAEPNAEVLAKLRAFGHDTDGLRSKSWDEFTGPSAPRRLWRGLGRGRNCAARPCSRSSRTLGNAALLLRLSRRFP